MSWPEAEHQSLIQALPEATAQAPPSSPTLFFSED